MGWADPAQQHGLSPARVNSALNCSHATWTMEAWQGRKGCREGWPVVASRRCCWRWWLQRRCWGHDGALLASSYLLCRGESLCFSCSFSFFSSARRAAAAGVDREEAQRWRCWAEGGRPPPLPLPQPSLSFFFLSVFSLSSSFLVLLFPFFSQHC